MINLQESNISYALFSSEKLSDVSSVLYAKDYHIIQIKEFYRGNYDESAIAFGSLDNDDLRKDVIFLLNTFKKDSAIIKYVGESKAKRIFRDGSEVDLKVIMYNTDSENISYLHEGISFSFIEDTKYWKPSKKEDFKIGMIVEYLNNNKWYERKVQSPSDEYDKIYKLLIKYDRVRVASK